jgi:cytochrome c peroxidase
MIIKYFLVLNFCALLIDSCYRPENKDRARSEQKDINQIPLGLMSPVFPTGTPPTQREIALGKKLFFDFRLSSDGKISCASCHKPANDFGDNKSFSIGVNGITGFRNSPSLLNSVYFESFGWDGMHNSLEEQTLFAMTNSKEMGMTWNYAKEYVQQNYGVELKNIYNEISLGAISKAIASFQRTLIAGNSSFDKYVFNKDNIAINESAKRGFRIFLTNGRCNQCHIIRCDECHPFGGTTAFFTDNKFHNLGIGMKSNDNGRFKVTHKIEDVGKFKTPGLRNVAVTAPFMHDGSLKTLDEVIEHYNKGGISNKNLDPELKPLNLSAQNKKDLVEFLKSLTSSTH